MFKAAPLERSRYLNTPLHNQKLYYDMDKPHPMPIIVAFIAEGIKKLRSAYAQREKSAATSATHLWRGMKGVDVPPEFLKGRTGGTELAPMSTSTDLRVAAKYSLSSGSLLFKIAVENFMQ